MAQTTDLERTLGPSYLVAPVYLGQSLDQTGKLTFFHGSSALGTIFQAGNATAEMTYTLPTAGPGSNGQALTGTTVGVLSWATYPALNSPFVTIGNDATLTGERALTGTASQITVTDNGVNSTVVLSLPSAIVLPGSLTVGGNTTGDSNHGTIDGVTNSNFYRGHFTVSFTGPGSISTRFDYVLTGTLITFVVTSFTVASTSAVSFSASSGTIPSSLRPGSTFVAGITDVLDNSAEQTGMGRMVIGTGGDITYSKTLAGGAFTGSGNAGLGNNASFSYVVGV